MISESPPRTSVDVDPEPWTKPTHAPPTPPRRQLPPWRRELARAIRSVDELLDLLDLDRDALRAAGVEPEDPRRTGFPLRVPRGFVARMRPGDPHDPLLRQVLSVADELDSPAGWTSDPLCEVDVSPTNGLLHKYRGRVLLVVTGACAVHCRYCFRRHFPYAEHQRDQTAALEHIAADPSIEEVILSGGDPLSLPDDKLARLAARIEAIPHVVRLRVHSRLPIVLPERVDEALLAWLGGGRLRPVLVVHANHAREIDASVTDAVRRLREAGVVVLNQAVLLAGVNDSVSALRDLSAALFDSGVMPYYLHVMDRVRGAAHFDVAPDTARRLLNTLRGELSGYLVPRLVREIPGASSKTPLD